MVEDDPDIRHCLARLLGRDGFSVAAADGRLALDYIRRHFPPRLVLLDLMMPEMDDWEFLYVRRHRRDLWDVPVVVFSAVADSKAPDPRSLGVAEVLRKPFTLAHVLEAVRRYCGRPRVECHAPSRRQSELVRTQLKVGDRVHVVTDEPSTAPSRAVSAASFGLLRRNAGGS